MDRNKQHQLVKHLEDLPEAVQEAWHRGGAIDKRNIVDKLVVKDPINGGYSFAMDSSFRTQLCERYKDRFEVRTADGCIREEMVTRVGGEEHLA